MTVTMNIYQAKSKLSALVAAALRGETVIITRRNQPVVQMTAVPTMERRPADIYPMELGDDADRELLAPVWTDKELEEFGFV